jgi:AmmeMemoRadiSam system protein A
MTSRTLILALLPAVLACGSRSGRSGESTDPAPVVEAGVSEPAQADISTAAPATPERADGEPTDAERRLLLSLARSSIQTRLMGEELPQVAPECQTPYVAQPLACFVTLNTEDGNLRGCIGMFEADRPLWENVMDRARAAAFADPRFHPVEESELSHLVLEISILTPPQPLAFSSPEALLARLRPQIDGVILHTAWGSSTFLPQVWEQLPEREEFLGRLCEKHGAPEDCWRDPSLRVETYQAVVFSEEQNRMRTGDWFSLDANGRYTCPAAAGN